MSWSDDLTGKIQGPTRKSDFDRVFDNQQQLAAEFDNYHKWSTSGGNEGYHLGIARTTASGSYSASGTSNIFSQPFATYTANGLWRLSLFFWRSDTHSCFHELFIDEKTSNVDIKVSPDNGTSGTTCGVGHHHSGDVVLGSTADTASNFRVYVDASTNLCVDFYRATADAHYYFVAMTQISKFEA